MVGLTKAQKEERRRQQQEREQPALSQVGKVRTVSDELMAREVAKDRKIGPTVKVRAIAKGQYGYPMADVREVGTVFRYAVRDLKPFMGGKTYLGTPKKSIEFEGKLYELPAWCADANEPDPDAEEESDGQDFGEGEQRSDDVL